MEILFALRVFARRISEVFIPLCQYVFCFSKDHLYTLKAFNKTEFKTLTSDTEKKEAKVIRVFLKITDVSTHVCIFKSPWYNR